MAETLLWIVPGWKRIVPHFTVQNYTFQETPIVQSQKFTDNEFDPKNRHSWAWESLAGVLIKEAKQVFLLGQRLYPQSSYISVVWDT